MASTMKSIGSAVVVLLLAAGGAALVYARWTRDIDAGDKALAAGQYEQALAAYRTAEAHFDKVPAAQRLFKDDYNRVVANELWLLYQLGRYDETIDKAESAPAGASPHFWSACALYDKALVEQKADARLGWLTRAEDEFRRAVEASPGDWNTKYNFELTTRLAAELRKQPKTPPKQLMQLLRPPPQAGKQTRKVG
jgi:tetratricopeptide (TPR) repeat protein